MNCKQTTDTLTDWHIGKLMNRKKSKKPTLSIVKAGFPDTEYLYYPLDVECVTLKGSLLPANIRKNKQ